MTEEAKKGQYGFGKPRKHKLHYNAKYSLDLIKPISKMIALGMTEKDIGLIVGVAGDTIQKWKQRYPQFKEACEEAKKVCGSHLVAQAVRASIGYDYEEKIYNIIIDEETGEEKRILKEVKVKHQKGEPSLIMFLATNFLKGQFTHKLEIDKKNINLTITGELAKDEIESFAGKLLSLVNSNEPERKKIESKVIEN